MAKSIFEAPEFRDPEAARAILETELWPDGPVCAHCGETERRYETNRPGRYRCGNPKCRKDYTVTTKTVMEKSHIPLHQWLQAFHLAASSKKGFSAHQLHRTLKVTYKAAWFLFHRVREAMRTGGLDIPMSGPENIVEIDETYFGPVEHPAETRRDGTPFKRNPRRRQSKGVYPGVANKRPIVTLVERGGNVRSFHVPRADRESVLRIVSDNVAYEARLDTDESGLYKNIDGFVAKHETVNHSRKEYVRGDVHVNSAEGYFSIFKRGMRGVYQHCGEKHLHRYLAEFDFRYNHRAALGYTDEMRTSLAIKGAANKRLVYKKPNSARL
jgi:transposase-like protein